jgi:hypothetical protein
VRGGERAQRGAGLHGEKRGSPRRGRRRSSGAVTGSRLLRTSGPHEFRSCLRRSFPIARAQAASSASSSREGLTTDFIVAVRGGAVPVENCFCGVNARRRSMAEQVEHLNERCSYPGALMILAGTICSKRIVPPHTTQRIATTQLNTGDYLSKRWVAHRVKWMRCDCEKRVALMPHAAMSAAVASSTTNRYRRPRSSLAHQHCRSSS